MQSCVVLGEGGGLVASQNLPAEVLLGVSTKGIEVRCLMPFCVFVPDGVSGIYALNHPPRAGRFYATHTDHALRSAVTYIKTRTRANNLVSPYAYSALGS
jgi:hypothetical protein